MPTAVQFRIADLIFKRLGDLKPLDSQFVSAKGTFDVPALEVLATKMALWGTSSPGPIMRGRGCRTNAEAAEHPSFGGLIVEYAQALHSIDYSTILKLKTDGLPVELCVSKRKMESREHGVAHVKTRKYYEGHGVACSVLSTIMRRLSERIKDTPTAFVEIVANIQELSNEDSADDVMAALPLIGSGLRLAPGQAQDTITVLEHALEECTGSSRTWWAIPSSWWALQAPTKMGSTSSAA